MKKLQCIMVITLVLLVTDVVFAFTEEEAQSRIRIAQQLLIKVDSALRLRPYMSTDIYSAALTELLAAQNLVTEKKYSMAYYKATMACVKFKTLPILAEAKEVREQILAQQPAPRENVTVQQPEKQEKLLMLGSETQIKELIAELIMQPEPEPEIREKISIPEPVKQENKTVPPPVVRESKVDKSLSALIIKASLESKGDVYRRHVPDSVLFMVSQYSLTYSLTPRGKKILDLIIDVVKFTGSASITIAGYSSQNDGPGYSWMKAEAVSKYFFDAGIPPARITVYGLGDAEVMESPLGNMRVDRVEVIISGLNVN